MEKLSSLTAVLFVSKEPSMEFSSGSGVPSSPQHSGSHHPTLWPQLPADAGWATKLKTRGFYFCPCLIPVLLSLTCVAPGGFKLRVSGVPSSTLLSLHADTLASLFTPDGQPYLLEVKFTFSCLWTIQMIQRSLVTLGYNRTRETFQSHNQTSNGSECI